MTAIGLVSYISFFLTVALIYGIGTMGLNLQWGFTGLFNAGVVGFFAIGGYAYAIIIGPDRANLVGGFEMPFLVGLLGSLVFSALAAVIVGLATMRLRSHYLAIATFGIALTIQLVALNFEPLTAGNLGLIGLPRPLWHTIGSPLGFNLVYLGLVLLATVVVYVMLQAILRSPWGRVLRSIREDEEAAISLGKDVRTFRLQAFVIGCALMGLSGALYVGAIGYISPFDFLPIVTFQIWTMLIVGGSGNNLGAILGSIVVWGIWTSSGWLVSVVLPPDWQARGAAGQVILIGLLLVLTLLYRPRGLIGEQVTVSRGARVERQR
ncbi:MAG: branched-chain amino acid ABC transporter permease [Phycisphaerales bacterium]